MKKNTLIGLNKIKRLYQHTYRRHYLKGLVKESSYYLQCMQIAKEVAVIDLSRPVQDFQLDQLLDFVEEDLQNMTINPASQFQTLSRDCREA